MSVNVQNKKQSWLTRFVNDVDGMVDSIKKARDTAEEYVDEAYNGGDLVNRAAYQITDADLASMAPQLDAGKLNAVVGALASVVSAYAGNAGVIQSIRP